jgi:thiol-disulfide isomerase/thioredoxin
MGETIKPLSRSTLFVTLLASGIFLIGAGLLPLLINAQQKALERAVPILAPATANFPGPQMALTDVDSNPVSMGDYQGQVILVNNWATWCPPCVTEMPELQAYYAAHVKNGFAVIAIDAGDPANLVATFVKENGLTFLVWLDPLHKSMAFFNNWDLPSSYVIDRNGIVRCSWMGGINQATLEKYVTPLLEANK